MMVLSPEEVIEIYCIIAQNMQNMGERVFSRQLRKDALNRDIGGFNKVAFDTRRINSETEYNPRRNLQHYHRSEAFISEGMAQRIKNFSKLRNVLNQLKEIYGKDYEWQDSNSRILLTALDNGLRKDINDGDFSINQPGLGSFAYLDQLINARYRLTHDNLDKMSDTELKNILLSKDECLIRKEAKDELEITKKDISTQNYDSLIEKLLNGCKATEINKKVKRSIIITIEDEII